MKMNTIYNRFIACILGMCLLSACFEDESVVGTEVPDITIGDFEESSYTRVAYVGQTLDLNPVVTSGYAEDDLSYLWTIVPDQSQDNVTETYEQPVEIATSKQLSYPVNIDPNEYVVRLQVTSKSNAYSVSKTVKLTVTTRFSQGFYILKEDAAGNSDLDLLLNDGTHSADLLSQIRDEGAMKGAPLSLSMGYDHCYINEANEMDAANMICVTTKEGEIGLFRATDLKELYNRSNLLFAEMEEDEKPYMVQFGMWALHYLSNKGVRTNLCGQMQLSSGKYGFPYISTGGSIYMTRAGYNAFYWDEDGHQLYLCDYNGGVYEVTDSEGMPMDLSAYECIGCGTNRGSTVLFVLQDRTTKERFIYQINSGGIISEMFSVSASARFAASDMLRLNGLQATYFYCVENNVLYGYDWTAQSEKEMPLKGIGSGETITYLSNQFMTQPESFDYLVVGTTKGGNDYTLYFYKMVGGIPDGEPVMKASGTGRVNNVRYISPSFSYIYAYSGIVYPYMD